MSVGYSRKVVITCLKIEFARPLVRNIQSHFVFLRPETESNFTYEYSGAYRAGSITNIIIIIIIIIIALQTTENELLT